MLKNILQDNRKEIIKKWFNAVIESYPKDSHRFFKQTKNRFGNPVGYIFSREIEKIFDLLIGGLTDSESLDKSLDNIIRIKAVQEFNASEAVGFLFLNGFFFFFF